MQQRRSRSKEGLEAVPRRQQSRNGNHRSIETQLADLERLQRERELERQRESAAIEAARRNKKLRQTIETQTQTRGARAGQRMPSGGVRLSGGPVLTDNELSSTTLESDVSSIIDISDAIGPSDTEDELRKEELALQDKHKYRLPDCGKTRLNLRTKEPLSPRRPQTHTPASNGMTDKPLPPVPSRRDSSPPATPRTTSSSTIHASVNGSASSTTGGMEFPPNWHIRNTSAETTSDSEFSRPPMSRANSIYTLGRASFTGQLATLTSMRLPDADSLAKRISALPNSTEAAKALSDASEQIRLWIAKASEVLEGLKAEDDVEWAAAGGREGIEDVDKAISRFQRLVEVYIVAIENLQTRGDVAQLSAGEIQTSIEQMESIVASWKKIKDTLNGVRSQVEIAMEWQRLWDDVLGEIAQEMEGLHRLVFEMEENRHQGSESVLSSKDTIDISELETIVEEQPGGNQMQRNRLSIQVAYGHESPTTPPPQPAPQDREDSSLLALFARMQPLRASMDFLPMRLSAFQSLGNSTFPSACIDLEQRRDQLELQWQKLEADAESLRRELGEDRWVTVFRNAGRQAMKMCESITRSFQKLKDAIDATEQQTSPTAMQNKIENYEQKKRHYGPAIERVLAIIDRGVTDRLTANGEILRLQSEMKRLWADLQAEMGAVDAMAEEIKEELVNVENRDKHLRDSVSTVISSERSIASSLGVDTPGSSPASSVIATGTSRKSSFGSRTPTSLTNIKLRSSNSKPIDRLSLTPSSLPKRTVAQKKSLSDMHSSQRSPSSSLYQTPSRQSARPGRSEATPPNNKPRFLSALKPENKDFKPLSAYEPSPYAKPTTTPKYNYLRSGLGNNVATRTPISSTRISSAPSVTPSSLPRPSSSMTSLRKSSLPVSNTSATPSRPRQSLSSKASAPALRPGSRLAGARKNSMLATQEEKDGNEADSEAPAHQNKRPPSALAAGGRSSVMQGRRSRLGETSSTMAGAERPPWRP